MTRVKAATLEEAYIQASKMLACSISELQYEIVQHPSKGIFGFMKKDAIILASCKKPKKNTTSKNKNVQSLATKEENVASEIMATVKDNAKSEVGVVEPSFEKDAVAHSFIDSDKAQTDADDEPEEGVVYDELALRIENDLKELLSHSCYSIDVVEVDVHDNTALIFIDGDDVALLIGKEGYRYNALSYMLFNWLHSKYELFIKLEIAEFLTSQEEMIRNSLIPIIETVEKTGRAKTRFLDGILIQIALEQLRERFADKYVAVKTTKNGKKFVIVNEFYTKHNES